MLALLNPELSLEESGAAAEAVFKLELDIASAHLTKTEKRDPVATYNKMAISAMQDTLCEGKFNFNAYFSANGKESEEIGEVNVAHTKAIKHATSLIESTDADVLENYLRWHTVSDFASFLP